MAKKEKRLSEVFTAGFIKENPVLRLVLGTCPTLAISTMAFNGIGMGIAATAVLVGSNAVISLLRNVIPDKVRIPAYITVIAGFVTIIQMLIMAYAPAIYDALGIYLPLIVVNCIILGRAESFAGKNKVLPSILDGLGMGIGFTTALFIMGSIREIIGSGEWFGFKLLENLPIEPMMIMVLPPGGFFVFGLLIALANRLAERKGKEPATLGCGGCPMASSCTKAVRIEVEEVKEEGGRE